MRIVCPSCTATYDVPAELVADRPVVRCVQCTQEWKLGEARASMPLAGQMGFDTLLARIPPEVMGAAAQRADMHSGSMSPSAAEANLPLSGSRTNAGQIPRRPEDSARLWPHSDWAAPDSTVLLASNGMGEDQSAVALETVTDTVVEDDHDALTARSRLAMQDTAATVPPQAAFIDAIVAAQSPRITLFAIFSTNLLATVGWAFSLGILVALSWMAVQHRTGIMHAWPPSQRLFGWLGLA